MQFSVKVAIAGARGVGKRCLAVALCSPLFTAYTRSHFTEPDGSAALHSVAVNVPWRALGNVPARLRLDVWVIGGVTPGAVARYALHADVLVVAYNVRDVQTLRRGVAMCVDGVCRPTLVYLVGLEKFGRRTGVPQHQYATPQDVVAAQAALAAVFPCAAVAPLTAHLGNPKTIQAVLERVADDCMAAKDAEQDAGDDLALVTALLGHPRPKTRSACCACALC